MSEPIAPSSQDRLLSAIRELIRAELPQLTFLGTYEYVVDSSNGSTVDAYPTDTTIPLPTLRGVQVRMGVPGGSCQPSSGTKLGITFLNGDPSRPIVAGIFDDTSAKNVTFDTGHGTSEHLISTEAVVNLFINFIYLLNGAGDIANWANPGKILDPISFPAQLQLLVTTWLSSASAPIPPTAVLGGGLISQPIYAAIQAAIQSKLPNDLGGTLPYIGCPNLEGG